MDTEEELLAFGQVMKQAFERIRKLEEDIEYMKKENHVEFDFMMDMYNRLNRIDKESA